MRLQWCILLHLSTVKVQRNALFYGGLWKTHGPVDGWHILHYVGVMDSMKALLNEIEAYLRASGMAPTRFGVEADNDRHLVRRVRAGRPVTIAKAERIINYMRENPPPKPIRCRRRVASPLSLVA